MEVAVGLGILEVEIAGVDCVAKKFEGFVAMYGESSATGEIVIGTAKTWLARLLPNGLNAVGIDCAGFGVVAFDEESGGEAGMGPDGFGMIEAKNTALRVQDGALKFFGFGKFAIPLESAAEVAGGDEGIGIIPAKNASLSVENFVIDGFGFSETRCGIERIGEIGFDGKRVWVVGAEDMGARVEGFALKLFRFAETAKFLKGAGEI